MSLKNFEQHVNVLFAAIDSCEANKFILPELMLIYSGIDIVASLERKEGEGTRKSFVKWVDEYILKRVSLPCTALELYAARCGILHSLTAKSDLSNKGQAREFHYAWGTANAESLQETSKRLRYTHVAIHVSQLKEGFRQGVNSYIEELKRDPAKRKIASEKTGLWFSNLSKELLTAFLSLNISR